MNDGLFHFKRFSVAHTHSSMKVGVDAVLLGAWADSQGDVMLDVGTGCGVIALMIAQRNATARVLAIDVDEASVAEASENFAQSPWSGHLEATLTSFSELTKTGRKFDRIVSNPPYFDSGVKDFSTSRNVARHQGELSPSVLVKECGDILTERGKLAMIVPSEFYGKLKRDGEDAGLRLSRACFVKGTPLKEPKRVMMEFSRETYSEDAEPETLTMFDGNGNPTEEYRLMERDFYLKF